MTVVSASTIVLLAVVVHANVAGYIGSSSHRRAATSDDDMRARDVLLGGFPVNGGLYISCGFWIAKTDQMGSVKVMINGIWIYNNLHARFGVSVVMHTHIIGALSIRTEKAVSGKDLA